MDSTYGWKGKQVRNDDGRTGVIALENEFGPWLDLHIECSDGAKAKVRLNANGRDSGETGWHWWCPEFCSGARWISLGDHNKPD